MNAHALTEYYALVGEELRLRFALYFGARILHTKHFVISDLCKFLLRSCDIELRHYHVEDSELVAHLWSKVAEWERNAVIISLLGYDRERPFHYSVHFLVVIRHLKLFAVEIAAFKRY